MADRPDSRRFRLNVLEPGETYEMASERLGIPKYVLYQVSAPKGRSSSITLDHLMKLCKAYDIELPFIKRVRVKK